MRKLLNKFLYPFACWLSFATRPPLPPISNPQPQPKEGTIKDAYAMAMRSQSQRIKEWVKSPVRVESAQEMFLNPTFQDMLWCVRNEKPLGLGADTDIQSATMLGRIQGYEIAMSNWDRLRFPSKESVPITATYGAEKILREQEPR